MPEDTNTILHPINLSKGTYIITLLSQFFPLYIITHLSILLGYDYKRTLGTYVLNALLPTYSLQTFLHLFLVFRLTIHIIKNGFSRQKIPEKELWGNSKISTILYKSIHLIALPTFAIMVMVFITKFNIDYYYDKPFIPLVNLIWGYVLFMFILSGILITGVCCAGLILYNNRRGNNNDIYETVRQNNRRNMIIRYIYNLPIISSYTQNKKVYDKGNICPYCLEEIEPYKSGVNNDQMGIVGSCNTNHKFHISCIKEHETYCRTRNEEFRCPLCRELWTNIII